MKQRSETDGTYAFYVTCHTMLKKQRYLCLPADVGDVGNFDVSPYYIFFVFLTNMCYVQLSTYEIDSLHVTHRLAAFVTTFNPPTQVPSKCPFLLAISSLQGFASSSKKAIELLQCVAYYKLAIVQLQ